jgi:prepilin-type N-terminal cleavage/methylation domain-containing protein
MKRGFTLVELVLVMAIVAVLLSLGLPALQNMIHRSKIEGAARTTASMMRNARFEAIKQAVPVIVRIDTASNDVVAFVDENSDFTLDASEQRLGQMNLPGGVAFAGPASQPFVDGLDSAGTAGWASFVTDGSVTSSGAFRLADQRGNFLEVRVEPAATARIQIRKWDGSDWRYQGEGGSGWTWY